MTGKEKTRKKPLKITKTKNTRVWRTKSEDQFPIWPCCCDCPFLSLSSSSHQCLLRLKGTTISSQPAGNLHVSGFAPRTGSFHFPSTCFAPLHASICLPDYPPRCSLDIPGGSPKPNMLRYTWGRFAFPLFSFFRGFSHDQGVLARTGQTRSFSSLCTFQLGTNWFNQVMGIPPTSTTAKVRMNSGSFTFLFHSAFCSSWTPG